ncbi:MAG: hypothetical protein U0670_19485 [Anaerolineae bacterium]
MAARNYLWYELRIAFGWGSILPTLLFPAYALLGWAVWASHDQQPALSELAVICELLLPLTAGLLAAHLMSIERDEAFDNIRRSYPETWWRVPLMRTVMGVALILCAAAFSALIFRMAYGENYSVSDLFLPALPPALYLLALALLVNNLTGNAWASAAVILGYWFIEYIARGQYTGPLFLFRATMPNATDYGLNRGLLTSLSLMLMVVNALYSGWRRRGRG